jgi:hypothetical protein
VLVMAPLRMKTCMDAVEESDSNPKARRRASLVAKTAPQHEKFVQARLIAKQIQSFLPLDTSVSR